MTRGKSLYFENSKKINSYENTPGSDPTTVVLTVVQTKFLPQIFVENYIEEFLFLFVSMSFDQDQA